MALPFASYFDHTLLRPTASVEEIETLCQEAIEHSFYSVCVNPCWLSLCQRILLKSSVQLCTVVGFPLGANDSVVKLKETELALLAGAQEIDCVLNIGFLKSNKFEAAGSELKSIVNLCKNSALVKVIVESGILSVEELKVAIQLVNESGAEFIKTSTGFANVGATEDAIKNMQLWGRSGLKIKASGGIKTATDFNKFVAAGASRIGASQSVAILKELLEAQ
jgi:deoxyribose-phosphate aldolase